MERLDLYKLRIREAIKNLQHIVLKNNNIVAVGRGKKIVNERMYDKPSLTFFVEKKLSKSSMSKFEFIPKEIFGINTDIIELSSYNKKKDNLLLKSNGNEDKVISEDNRPALGGGCIYKLNDKKEDARTLTYAVTDKGTRKNIYFLANGDFFFTKGKFKRLTPVKYTRSLNYFNDAWVLGVADKIVQNGLNKENSLYRSNAGLGFVGTNTDKIRELIVPGVINGKIIVGTDVPKVGDIIYNYGIASRYKEGTVLAVDTSVKLGSSGNKLELLVEQIVTDQDTEVGDEGALGIIKKNNKAFGMINEERNGFTFYGNINHALNDLGVELLI